MTVKSDSGRSSRRALLAGTLAGIGAWAVSAVGRASPVRGAGDDGAAVVIGGGYPDARSQTTIANQANNASVLWVASNADLGNGTGVAITGFSAKNIGVDAWGPLHTGVRGRSDSGTGVIGRSETWIGVDGIGGHVGVIGSAGGSATGTGVLGHSAGGVALDGETLTGFALRTNGRLKIEKVSGVAAISAGSTSKTVTPGVDVTAGSFVLLTPKVNLGGRSLWFTNDPTANSFTIKMSSKRSSATRIAWLLLG